MTKEFLKSAWSRLPYGVRDHVLVQTLKNSIKDKIVTTETNSYIGPTTFGAKIQTIEELDSAIRYAAYLERTDQDAFFKFVRSWSAVCPEAKIETDPFSEAYRKQQEGIFKWFRGASYTSRAEALPIYVRQTIDNPYPYSTRSSDLVANQLLALGQTLKALQLPPGSAVLEMGAGHGSTTLQLSQLGYQVTVLDISSDFLKVVKGRLAKIGKSASYMASDFLNVSKVNKKFDAVIFDASFHHCSDHQALIKILRNILNPGGKILFCNEPINDEFYLPWALRLDGESIYHIRLHGWLELGFKESYFMELLKTNGWSVEKRAPLCVGLQSIYIAKVL